MGNDLHLRIADDHDLGVDGYYCYYYRLRAKRAKVMFSQASVCSTLVSYPEMFPLSALIACNAMN